MVLGRILDFGRVAKRHRDESSVTGIEAQK